MYDIGNKGYDIRICDEGKKEEEMWKENEKISERKYGRGDNLIYLINSPPVYLYINITMKRRIVLYLLLFLT